MITGRPQHDGYRSRRGISSVEVIVAFTLLSVMLSVSTSLLVKHGRMLQAQRQYRTALDELSNQLERLTALPPDELEQAVDQLSPSAFAEQQLPGVQLEGELQQADLGRRVILRIWWDEPQRSEAPVSLAAWILPDRADNESQPSGDDPS